MLEQYSNPDQSAAYDGTEECTETKESRTSG